MLTVLRRVSDTEQVLIEHIVTESDFQIETFSARPVSFIRSAKLFFLHHHSYDRHHHDLFTDSSSAPSLQLHYHHLRLDLYCLLQKCYGVFPTDLPLGSPPPPSALQKTHEGTHLLAPQIWSFLSLLPIAYKTNSFSSSFDLLGPLEYGSSYLPLQLSLLWSLPPSLPVLSEWAPHGTMLDLGPCTLASVFPVSWIPPATPSPTPACETLIVFQNPLEMLAPPYLLFLLTLRTMWVNESFKYLINTSIVSLFFSYFFFLLRFLSSQPQYDQLYSGSQADGQR